MTEPQQRDDQVDLISVVLQRHQLMSLINGNVVRVDIPASGDIPATVVILRHARSGEEDTGADLDEVPE